MNGYLVLVRCLSDDVPVAFVSGSGGAISIAASIDCTDSQYVDDVVSLPGWPVPSISIGVKVIEFSGGRPAGIVYSRSFDD